VSTRVPIENASMPEHPYLRRRKGLEDVTYPIEYLEPVLHKTLWGCLYFRSRSCDWRWW